MCESVCVCVRGCVCVKFHNSKVGEKATKDACFIEVTEKFTCKTERRETLHLQILVCDFNLLDFVPFIILMFLF